MVQIPDYQARQGLAVQPTPSIQVDNSIGQGLSQLGNAVTVASEQFKAHQDRLNAYKTNLQVEKGLNELDVAEHNDFQNGALDGSDLVGNTKKRIDDLETRILGGIADPETKLKLKGVFEAERGKRTIASMTAAESKGRSYVLATTGENIATTLQSGKINTVEEFNTYFDSEVKPRIDGVIPDAIDRQKAYDVFRTQLRSEFLRKNPTMALPRKNAATSAGADPHRGKQLAFAVHELNTTEKSAGAKLRGAQTIEQAVDAGLAFERPSIPARENRIRNARNVLAGTAPKEALQARAYFEAQGYSPVQAAGFVGSLMQESGMSLDPRAANPNDPGTSIGIGQWNGPRKAAMLEFTGQSGDVAMPDAGGLARYSPPEMPTGGIFEGMTQPEWNSYLKQSQFEAASRISATTPDELSSLEFNGSYTGRAPLTHEDFLAAYGVDGDQKFLDYEGDRAVALQKHKYRDMNATEILADLNAKADQVGTGDGAARQITDLASLQDSAKAVIAQRNAARQDYLAGVERRATAGAQRQVDIANNRTQRFVDMQREKAAAITAANAALEQRKKDPAGYVFQTNQGVRQAWREVNQNDPSTRRAAIAATIAAQETLGIPGDQIMPLPMAQAEAITAVVKDETRPVDQRMASLVDTVNSAEKPKHQEAIIRQLVKTGLTPKAANVIEATRRNDMGAARRLFQASMIDSAKAPKLGSEDATLGSSVEEAMLGDGTIGQVFYGLDLGDPGMGAVAASDLDLAKSAARLAMAGGMGQDEAIAQAVSDIFGAVDVFDTELPDGGSVHGLIDTGTDTAQLYPGFAAATTQMTDVVQGYLARSYGQVPVDASPEMKAIYKASHVNEMNRIMSDGVWRNIGGRWGFFDPQSRGFVSDDTGKAITYSTDEIIRMGSDAPRQAAPGMDPAMPMHRDTPFLTPGDVTP